MSPKTIQIIQNELAIIWDDGSEHYISLEKLRRFCPCAACAGEKDIFGNEYKGAPVQYRPESFKVNKFQNVGDYAVNFVWGDGHNSGIYTYPYLRKIGEGSTCSGT
jgi:DUF971 family protein